MKTIQISDGLWKRLKLASVERGVPMREVVEEMGVSWFNRTSGTVTITAGADVVSIHEAAERASAPRELVVELEE